MAVNDLDFAFSSLSTFRSEDLAMTLFAVHDE